MTMHMLLDALYYLGLTAFAAQVATTTVCLLRWVEEFKPWLE
jgi:hypothetical protein